MKPLSLLRQQGLTLIELMIAMTLGLLLMLGVTNIYVSSHQAFRSSENLAGIQENSRFAFEMMSRDIREADSNPCGARIFVYGLNGAIPTELQTPIRGYDGNESYVNVTTGGATGNRIAGTQGLLLIGAATNRNLKIVNHQPTSATLFINKIDHGLKDGDIAVACNAKIATIFQITNTSSSNVTVVHNTGNETPGNCTKGLGYRDPAAPNCTKPNAYLEDMTGGSLYVLEEKFWYIGNNNRNGRSLFRANKSGGTVTIEEMVENVTGIELFFLTKNISAQTLGLTYTSITDTKAVTDWKPGTNVQVVSIRTNLTLESRERVDTTKTPAETLQRATSSTVQIRARETL